MIPLPKGRVVGFAGSREATPEVAERIHLLVAQTLAVEYRTGACVGVDEAVARSVAELWPLSRNVVIVPADRSRVSQAFLDWAARTPRVVIEFMPKGTTYRDRNARIIEDCDELIGFPADAESAATMRRSGSWQTIRMARARGIQTRVYCRTDAGTAA